MRKFGLLAMLFTISACSPSPPTHPPPSPPRVYSFDWHFAPNPPQGRGLWWPILSIIFSNGPRPELVIMPDPGAMIFAPEGGNTTEVNYDGLLPRRATYTVKFTAPEGYTHRPVEFTWNTVGSVVEHFDTVMKRGRKVFLTDGCDDIEGKMRWDITHLIYTGPVAGEDAVYIEIWDWEGKLDRTIQVGQSGIQQDRYVRTFDGRGNVVVSCYLPG